MLKKELEIRVKELEAKLASIEHQTIRMNGKPAVALPLTREERDAILPTIREFAVRGFGNGQLIRPYPNGKSYEGCWEDSVSFDDLAYDEDTLPLGWDGFLFRFEYTDTDGTHCFRVWGIKIIR
jgi:hypothetical protein